MATATGLIKRCEYFLVMEIVEFNNTSTGTIYNFLKEDEEIIEIEVHVKNGFTGDNPSLTLRANTGTEILPSKYVDLLSAGFYRRRVNLPISDGINNITIALNNTDNGLGSIRLTIRRQMR